MDHINETGNKKTGLGSYNLGVKRKWKYKWRPLWLETGWKGNSSWSSSLIEKEWQLGRGKARCGQHPQQCCPHFLWCFYCLILQIRLGNWHVSGHFPRKLWANNAAECCWSNGTFVERETFLFAFTNFFFDSSGTWHDRCVAKLCNYCNYNCYLLESLLL